MNFCVKNVEKNSPCGLLFPGEKKLNVRIVRPPICNKNLGGHFFLQGARAAVKPRPAEVLNEGNNKGAVCFLV